MMFCRVILAFLMFGFFGSYSQNSDDCPGIVSRKEWGGRPPKKVEYMIRPVPMVVIQHTVTPQCSNTEECSRRVRSIQNYHMNDRGWNDIGPSFLVGDNGEIYEGPGWYKIGTHTHVYNNKSIAISFIGNFEKNLPTKEALQAAQGLLACGVLKETLADDYILYAHRQLSNTDSPGEVLFHEIKTWRHWTEKVK